MQIYFVSSVDRRKYNSFKNESNGYVYLQLDEWNDWWEFKTQYFAVYVNSAGLPIELGHCKIVDPRAQANKDPKSPISAGATMKELPDDLISLGQSDSYYENLADLPAGVREDYCRSMRDSAWDYTKIVSNKSRPAIRKSLLRSVALSSVTGEWHRLLKGQSEKIYYDIRYSAPEYSLEFIVDPSSMPPTNLHAVIGRNGVGKTTLLRNIAESLVGGTSTESVHSLQVLDNYGVDQGNLAGIQYVSWSAFDESDDLSGWTFSSGIGYSEIGVKGIRELTPTASLEAPGIRQDINWAQETYSPRVVSFLSAFCMVLEKKRGNLLLRSLRILMSDPGFRRLNIIDNIERYVNEYGPNDSVPEEYLRGLAESFKSRLSDGHKVVLLTATYLAATLAERTMVVLDEPEAHLHPPLLSSLIKSLNSLLLEKNAIGIIATHSPVVLQELPKTCVWKIKRNAFGDSRAEVSRPAIETFGEDVGPLTYEVFELEVEDSGYFKTLTELAERHSDFNGALEELGGQLGVSGRSTLRSLFGRPGDS